jgi:hypothetical protein
VREKTSGLRRAFRKHHLLFESLQRFDDSSGERLQHLTFFLQGQDGVKNEYGGRRAASLGFRQLAFVRGHIKGGTQGVIPFPPYGELAQENLTLGTLFTGMSA